MLIESSLILAMSNTLGVSLLINSYVKHVMCMFADNGYVKRESLLINGFVKHIKCKLAH